MINKLNSYRARSNARVARVVAVLAVSISVVFLARCRGESGAEKTARLEKEFERYYNSLRPLKPLPKDKTYRLVVRYAVDPDLPAPSAESLQEIFRRSERLCRELLGYRVEFQLKEKIDLYKFFESRRKDHETAPFSYMPAAWYVDPRSPDAFDRTLQAVKAAISKKDDALLVKYFGPPLESERMMKDGSERTPARNFRGTPRQAGMTFDRAAYARRITDEFFRKLNLLYAERDRKGRPLYSPERKLHFSFAHWDAVAYREREADIIVTNTIIAGPDATMPIYVINRGGVTSAFIENNEFRQLGGVGIFPLYQFFSDGDFFNKFRGKLTHRQKLELTAYLWVHELGHLLARKAENYDLDGSIHKTAVDLDYLSWVALVKRGPRQKNAFVNTLEKF